MKNKILITGASSFLGWNLCKYAIPKFEVHGTVYRHNSCLNKVREHKIDICNSHKLRSLLEEVKPHLIIHNAAYSKPNLCEKDPEYSARVNVDATTKLAECAKELNIQFAFISTDMVFDGRKGFNNENSPTKPLSCYGMHKVKAESSVREIFSSATIFRCPLMYGFSGSVNKGYFPGFLELMKNGEILQLFTDEYRSQALADDVAKGIIDLMMKDSSGIFHMGGPARISRYEFGILMKAIFGLNKANIVPALQKDVQSEAPRASDTSLDSSKAIALGYNPSAPISGLLKLKEMYY